VRAPIILITVADHDADLDPARVALVNARYADGIRRAGGLPLARARRGQWSTDG